MTVSSSSSDELKQLVTSTLEHSGVLNKLRAQLRHHIFLATHNQQPTTAPTHPALSAGSAGGAERLLLELVDEYLLFHQLDYTAVTLEAEAGLTSSTVPHKRTRLQLSQHLKLDHATPSAEHKPLLYHILQQATQGRPTVAAASDRSEEEAYEEEVESEADVSTSSVATDSSSVREWDKTPVKRQEEEKQPTPLMNRLGVHDEHAREEKEADEAAEEEVEEDVEVEVEVSASNSDNSPSLASRSLNQPTISRVAEQKTPAAVKKSSLLGDMPSLFKPAAKAADGAKLSGVWRDDEDSAEEEEEEESEDEDEKAAKEKQKREEAERQLEAKRAAEQAAKHAAELESAAAQKRIKEKEEQEEKERQRKKREEDEIKRPPTLSSFAAATTGAARADGTGAAKPAASAEEAGVEEEVDEEFFESSPSDSPKADAALSTSFSYRSSAAEVSSAKVGLTAGSGLSSLSAASKPAVAQATIATPISAAVVNPPAPATSTVATAETAASALTTLASSTQPSKPASLFSLSGLPSLGPKPSLSSLANLPSLSPARPAAAPVAVEREVEAEGERYEDDAEVEEEIVDEVGSDVSVEISGDDEAEF